MPTVRCCVPNHAAFDPAEDDEARLLEEAAAAIEAEAAAQEAEAQAKAEAEANKAAVDKAWTAHKSGDGQVGGGATEGRARPLAEMGTGREKLLCC